MPWGASVRALGFAVSSPRSTHRPALHMVCSLSPPFLPSWQSLADKLGLPVYYEPVADNEYLEDFYGDIKKYSFAMQVKGRLVVCSTHGMAAPWCPCSLDLFPAEGVAWNSAHSFVCVSSVLRCTC